MKLNDIESFKFFIRPTKRILFTSTKFVFVEIIVE